MYEENKLQEVLASAVMGEEVKRGEYFERRVQRHALSVAELPCCWDKEP